MVILITGATHTGKTQLAQRMLEKYHIPYLSEDHLKMGMIRSANTALTPEDDDALTEFLFPIVREMIKTAIENEQDLIVEGCYVPFDWRRQFEPRYLSSIRFICLGMTDNYIEKHFHDVIRFESVVEKRFVDPRYTINSAKEDNRRCIAGFQRAGESVVLIDSDYEKTVLSLLT